MDLHRLLARQLRKLGIDAENTPSTDAWKQFLSAVDTAYQESDKDRYTLERALNISSAELQEQNQQQKSTYEQRLKTIFSTLQDLIWLKDTNGVYLACNEMFERFFGATEEEIIGKTDYDFVDKALADSFRKYDLAAMEKDGPSVNDEWITFASDGHRALLETTKMPMRNEAGQVLGVLGVSRDITDRRRAEEQQHLATSVFANSYEGILITDADNLITDANPAFTRITGYTKEEVLGKDPKVLASGRHGSAFYAQMWKSLQEHGAWRGEVWNRRKNGEIYSELLALSTVPDDSGAIHHYIGVFSDISTFKRHEAELDRIAHYDTLTGVPNRRLLADRLGQALARNRGDGHLLAVCYLDLDGFKPVNDKFGHEAGDHLLIEIASRLQGLLRGNDTIARLGGDEFVLLLTDLARYEECQVVLDRILAATALPVLIGNVPVSVSASIGVTLSPPDEADADTLLRHADQAMYKAKEGGRNSYHLFDAQQDRQMKVNRHRLNQLQRALKWNEFVLYYQPKVDLLSGEVFGVEALIRWEQPGVGLIPPGDFLPYLTGTDLEIEVGEWVIESALQQLESWKAAGRHLIVSVNVSAAQLLRPAFIDHLRAALERYPGGADGGLELEILESAALSDMGRAEQTLAECRKLGIRFALDDFGTGYSSLAYFRKLPVDVLKIDQSFVKNMLNDPNDLEIVDGVIRLAHAFNRPVIAEGVETMEHGATLVLLGCPHGQGYGIARPMPPEKLLTWAEQWESQDSWVRVDTSTDRQVIALNVAAQSHRNWITRVVNAIENGGEQILDELEAHRCRFGRWHQGSGVTRYGYLPEFKAIAPIHEHIHVVAAELVGLVQTGKRKAARARISELYTLHDRLLDVLDALTRKVMRQQELDRTKPRGANMGKALL